MPATIECQHCHETVPSVRPRQQKWCHRCRALKAIVGMGEKPAVGCTTCDRRYRQFTRGQHYCPECAAMIQGDAHVLQVPCAICGKEKALGFAREDLALCYECVASTDDERHGLVLRVAMKKLKSLAS